VSTSTPEDYFDRGKPFYPLVMVYLMGLRGFTMLAERGVVELHQRITGATPRLESIDGPLTGNSELDDGLRRLRAPLNLRAEGAGRPINVSLAPLAEELVENHGYLLPWLLPSLGSVLMLAQEIVVGQLTEAERLEPLLQFLHHARNAVAHNGCWEFRNDAPKRPAVWRVFTLNRSMHGEPLFNDGTGYGLLGPGDPIRLLWDIEQAYPRLTAHLRPTRPGWLQVQPAPETPNA
jgi:hypothetical protein